MMAVNGGSKLILFFLVTFALAACGQEDPVPPGASVLVAPGNVTYYTSAGVCSASNFDSTMVSYRSVVVSVQNADGSALGNIDVTLNIDWAGNTATTLETLELYHDVNGNTVLDAEDVKISGPGYTATTLQTAEYTGELMLIVGINVSCRYSGYLYAHAGTSVGTAFFELAELN